MTFRAVKSVLWPLTLSATPLYVADEILGLRRRPEEENLEAKRKGNLGAYEEMNWKRSVIWRITNFEF